MDEPLQRNSTFDGAAGAAATSQLWRRAVAAAGACEQWAVRAPLIFALLAVLALLSVAVVALRIRYDTNDDVFMTMIAAGQGFCPAPDEHLIFTNIVIGRALKWLYTAQPQVPWYGGYLLLVHYVAQTALLYGALATGIEGAGRGQQVAGSPGHAAPAAARRAFRARCGLYLVYFAVVELVMLNRFQFTTTAFLASQGAIVLLWLAAQRRARQESWSVVCPLVAAVALILVAGMIRLESLAMAALVALPLGVFGIWRGPRWALVPSAVAAGLAMVLVLAAATYHRVSYERDPQWSRFYAYNQLRCKFNDYGWTSYSPQTAQAFATVGWSANDHDMIARWFFDDPALYGEAQLRAVLDAYPWKTARLTSDYVAQMVRRPGQDRSVWAVMLVLPLFVAMVDDRGRARWAVGGCGVAAVALLVAIALNNKLPPMRTYFPLLSFPLSVVLLLPLRSLGGGMHAAAQGAEPKHRHRLLIAWRQQSRGMQAVLALLVVGTSMGVYRQCRLSIKTQRDRPALQSFLADARAENHKLYVCWEAALPFELVSPLDNLRGWSGVSLFNLTWTQRTPWQEATKRRFGIASLAQAMSERDDIVLVANPAHRAVFVTFVKEHFGNAVEFVRPKPFGDRFVAGRFARCAAVVAEGRDSAATR
jgi:hypothetical protein